MKINFLKTYLQVQMVTTSNITMKMRSGTDTIRAIIRISETGMGRERWGEGGEGGREEREGGGGRRGREGRQFISGWNESSNEVT